MKTFNSFNKSLLFVLLGLSWFSLSYGQNANDEAQSSIKVLLDSRNWVFKAETMHPLGGATRQLTTRYDVQLTDSTLVSYLPYFGRAYSAPIDPSSPALQFTSKKFEYLIKPAKKDSWSIVIEPKDVSDVRQLMFTVFENGKATLQVISNSRQSISFTGNIVGKA